MTREDEQDAPFVNRSNQLDLILEFLKEGQTRSGKTSMVWLGLPLMGKSRLLEEVLDRFSVASGQVFETKPLASEYQLLNDSNDLAIAESHANCLVLLQKQHYEQMQWPQLIARIAKSTSLSYSKRAVVSACEGSFNEAVWIIQDDESQAKEAKANESGISIEKLTQEQNISDESSLEDKASDQEQAQVPDQPVIVEESKPEWKTWDDYFKILNEQAPDFRLFLLLDDFDTSTPDKEPPHDQSFVTGWHLAHFAAAHPNVHIIATSTSSLRKRIRNFGLHFEEVPLEQLTKEEVIKLVGKNQASIKLATAIYNWSGGFPGLAWSLSQELRLQRQVDRNILEQWKQSVLIPWGNKVWRLLSKDEQTLLKHILRSRNSRLKLHYSEERRVARQLKEKGLVVGKGIDNESDGAHIEFAGLNVLTMVAGEVGINPRTGTQKLPPFNVDFMASLTLFVLAAAMTTMFFLWYLRVDPTYAMLLMLIPGAYGIYGLLRREN